MQRRDLFYIWAEIYHTMTKLSDASYETVFRPTSHYNFKLLNQISFQNKDLISNIINQSIRI